MTIAIVLGAFCGLRRSEICGLEWGDVDRSAGTIRIERAVVLNQDETYVTKGTKSRAGKRTISVSPETMATLTRRARIGDRLYKVSDRILSIRPHQISLRFAKAVHELEFDFTFHSLRHYHASIMLALNVPKAYIVENMGHSDFTMVERVYGQIVREKEAAMARIVGSHADTIIRGERFGWADEAPELHSRQPG